MPVLPLDNKVVGKQPCVVAAIIILLLCLLNLLWQPYKVAANILLVCISSLSASLISTAASSSSDSQRLADPYAWQPLKDAA